MTSGFSRRTAVDRTENRLSRALAARRARGEAILDLTVSNPTRAGLEYPQAAIAACLAEVPPASYDPQPLGLDAAREAVGARLGVTAERVVICASTSEAYGLLFKLLGDPGDAVLVPQPSYPLLEHLVRFESLSMRAYPLAYDGGWHVDLPELRAAAGAGAKAVVAVHPNNPTGSYLHQGEVAALGELGLPVIADEVFGRYALLPDPERVGMLANVAGLKAFSLGGLSKWVGLPQLKLSWIVVGGPPDWRAEALARLELLNDTWLGAATPVQRALPALLEVAEPVAAAIAARTARNLAALDGALGTAPWLTRLRLEGGWYAVLRVPATEPEATIACDLLEREGVLVHPGYFYDFAHEAFLVVSLVTEPGAFDEGVARLLRAFERSYDYGRSV